MADELLDIAAEHGCEALHLAADPATGLRAIVAVHSTVLGPSLGGTRFRPYPDERAAAVDVCRLARGMTYKHAVCGNDQGGGKAVIIGEPARAAQRRAAAGLRPVPRPPRRRVPDRRGRRHDPGRHGPAARPITPYVTGTSEHLGGSGDPSPATAWGVFHAIGAVAERLWGSTALAGRHVVVLGVGKVGTALARHLHDAGARLTLADVRADAVAAAGRASSAPTSSPPTTPSRVPVRRAVALRPRRRAVGDDDPARCACAAVCGAANNQLATDDDAERLADAGVLYAPDYVVNAGGVINIADETAPGGYDRERAWRRVETIADTLRRVFAAADEHGLTPGAAADRLAEDRRPPPGRRRTCARDRRPVRRRVLAAAQPS